MSAGRADPLRLLRRQRTHPLTSKEEEILANACRDILEDYRACARAGKRMRVNIARVRSAFLHLAGDPFPSSESLRHYDHERYGPFLGVSDDGSAATAIRDAALGSPKVKALADPLARSPLTVGVAVDAERLAGVGEVAVGPEEYAAVWLACVGRVLITTNVGTRVNVRLYGRNPHIVLPGDDAASVAHAKEEITAAFKPFIETPDGKPRPLVVFVEIGSDRRLTAPRQKALLRKFVRFVASGEAARRKGAPEGQCLGLAVSVPAGIEGRDATFRAIGLAAAAGMKVLLLRAPKRRVADQAISLAGLLDYFAPGIVGPLLRKAAENDISLRPANLPDTDTIARSIWVGLTTARRMGASLGKYGCFPLTRPETDHVVEQMQEWLEDWSAAPVFFVDQGLIREGGVDSGNDLSRGIRAWLDTVAKHRVRIVLIDTVDKATGRRLLKRSFNDPQGYLGLRQVAALDRYAKVRKIKVLWAGGLTLADTFDMGKLGVFGVYVTSAASMTVPVHGDYVRDPALSRVKRPAKVAVSRTKIVLEAGFLAGKLPPEKGGNIEALAQQLLLGIEATDVGAIRRQTSALARACESGWRTYWKTLKAQRRFLAQVN